MPDRKSGWTVPVADSSLLRAPAGRTRMSYAGRKCAETVPMVRICAVRAAAVSTVNAVAATRIPASRASARPLRNRSCDQAILPIAGTLREPAGGRAWRWPRYLTTLSFT